MCLPFNCGGGGDKGDEYAPQHDPSSVHHQPFHRPPPQQGPPQQPWAAAAARSDEESSPVKQAIYGRHHGTNTPAGGAGGEGKNNNIGGGGARPAPPQGYVADVNNKNGGGGRMMTDFVGGYSDGGDVGGVGRGRESAAPGRIAVASSTPAATQGFNNKQRDLAAAQQPALPQRTHQGHGHGYGSSAAPHPSEAADSMRAPTQVLPMARRGPQGY